jgi:hypothetical protein
MGVGGTGARGGLGFVQGEELEGEVEGSSRTCLPRAEIDGTGWNFRSTPATGSGSGSGGSAALCGGRRPRVREGDAARAARRRLARPPPL